MSMRPLSTLVLLVLAAACAPETNGTTSSSASSSSGAVVPPVYQRSNDILSCKDATLEAGKPLPEGQRCYTYRALGGVSMGGGGAARIGFHYPELFDAVGVMGTPFSDFDFFHTMLANNHLSGFCSREQILGVMAANAGNPDVLNDPTRMDTFCGVHGSDIPSEPALPDSQCWLFRSDFNHWYRGPDAGRGGGFKRPSLMEIIQDMSAMYGNFGYYNPESTYFPPGVPATFHIPPSMSGSEEQAMRRNLCDNPVIIEGLRNKEWNPDGTYPVITFCDCTGCDGDYPAGSYDLPTEVLLAVDYNRNGRRDYAEPVLYTSHERYLDVGVDGIADGESGDDANDTFHYLDNPLGLSGNYRYDVGETFEDTGLDGVPGTLDFGEGDGVYTMTPALERAILDSPTRWYERMSEPMAKRLDVWMDAGIRDFINSAQITNHLFGAIKARNPDSKIHRDFSGLANLPPNTSYSFTAADFSPSSIGRNAYLLYGKENLCPASDSNFGDGNHVGPADQVINRILTLYAFADARMPGGDRTYINDPGAADDHPLGFSGHIKLETYQSTTLGRAQEYGVVLPPGYFYPENADKTYPVVYFLHGQGQSAQDMVGSGAIFMGYMHQSSLPNKYDSSDMQKMILVFADGECHGNDCHTGNFYSNFQGIEGSGPQFEEAFLELIRHMDATYRTKKPEIH